MQPCTVRLPGCNADPTTTVFAHAPSSSKGMGIKSEDWWGSFSCSSCHDILDGRKKSDIPREEILERLLNGIHDTLRIQFRDGNLLIK
jgi:hypothetical protein